MKGRPSILIPAGDKWSQHKNIVCDLYIYIHVGILSFVFGSYSGHVSGCHL